MDYKEDNKKFAKYRFQVGQHVRVQVICSNGKLRWYEGIVDFVFNAVFRNDGSISHIWLKQNKTTKQIQSRHIKDVQRVNKKITNNKSSKVIRFPNKAQI